MAFCLTQPNATSNCFATSAEALLRYPAFTNVTDFTLTFDRYREIMYLYINASLASEYTNELSLQLTLHLIVEDYSGLVNNNSFNEGDFIGTTGPASKILAEKVAIEFNKRGTNASIHGSWADNVQTTIFGQNFYNLVTNMRRKYGVDGKGNMWKVS